VQHCNTTTDNALRLTVTVALTVFLTEILSHDASARVVTALARVVARHIVVYMT